jgi:hypothetical protein
MKNYDDDNDVVDDDDVLTHSINRKLTLSEVRTLKYCSTVDCFELCVMVLL